MGRGTITTIAYDGKTVAADGRCTSDSRLLTDKLSKIRDTGEEIVAVAGTQHTAFAWLDDYCSGLCPDPQPDDEAGENSFSVVIVNRKSKRAYLSYNGHPPMEVDIPCAIGSGGDIAMGAMLCGRSAKDAVKMASKRDLATGGRIQEVKL